MVALIIAMRLLLIGGSVFLGRALTETACAQGHEVTMLNRGQSSSNIPEGVEHLKADRDASLKFLKGRSWDALIDTCAYFPRQVRQLRQALDGQVSDYGCL
jgi:2'-hydroxyisoflavone reductase